MTNRRKVLIIAGALALAIIALIAYLLTNIDWIVKNAIEHYGSQATKTRVQVASVDIRLARGIGAIEGLTVANPKGFPSPHILSFGSISLRIEPRTVVSGTMVIDDIRITGPRITYEMDDSRASNIDALKKNIGTSEPAARKHPAEAGKAAKRLRIRKLVIENGRVDIRIAALGDRPRTVTLERIEMRDIGGAFGATPEQVAKEVIGTIISEAGREAAQAGTERLIRNGLDRALRRR